MIPSLFVAFKKIVAVFRRSAAHAPQRDEDVRLQRLLLQKKLQGHPLSIDEQFALQIPHEQPQPKPEDAA